MRSATGRWVSGDDFFDRGRELRILEQRVRDGNHVLLSGQRRMGKTSIVQELGRRLANADGWVTLFTDVEDAALGIGIPHHVQSFFARLKEFAVMENRDRVTVADVKRVYRTGLLGPSGQNDLAHYETRLHDALDEESRSIAMEILAEVATQGVFTPASRTGLGQLYCRVVPDVHGRITEVLDVLEHDGYLEARDDVYRFQLHPLRDWWAARFRNHHVPIADRSRDTAGEHAR